MKVTEILSEGLSPIVYHSTRAVPALNILRENEFVLRPVFTSSEHSYGGRGFFLSTSRSKTGSFAGAYMGNSFGGLVMFTLDGRKIGQRHLGKSVDFFGPNREDNYDEMEDRIFSDKPEIPAFPYILSVDISYPLSFITEETRLALLEIIKILDDRNIPYSIYNDYRHLVSGLKNKAIDKNTALSQLSVPRTSKTWPKYKAPRDFNVKDLMALILFASGKTKKLPKTTEKLLNMDRLEMLINSALISASDDIVENKSSREYLQMIYRFMRANKLRSYKDLYEWIRGNLDAN